jgi:hypothetical protein
LVSSTFDSWDREKAARRAAKFLGNLQNLSLPSGNLRPYFTVSERVRAAPTLTRKSFPWNLPYYHLEQGTPVLIVAGLSDDSV